MRSHEFINETAEGNPLVDLTPNYPNYQTLVGEYVGVKKNRLQFRIVRAELKLGQGATEKIVNALATGRAIGIDIERVRNRRVIGKQEPAIDEVVQPEIVNQQKFHHEYHDEQGLLWAAVSSGNFDLVVDVRDHNNSIIAYATFEVNPDENSISSIDTWVSDRYRRQGIASKMYNWAQELGNTVVKSGTLLPKGKRFWAARDKSRST